jgi:malate-CoA ligase subunit beta
VYVEVAEPFEREFYLGFVLDRKAERIRVIASKHGGMEIEEIAQRRPDRDPAGRGRAGGRPAAVPGARARLRLGLNLKQVSQATATILGAYRAFRDLDATMVEINPLVVTKDDRVLALDAKMSFDDNALFRRPQVSRDARPVAGGSARGAGRRARPELRRPRRRHRLHHQRRRPRDGDDGHDQARRRQPANFLDVGGGASPERVAQAFRLVLSDRGEGHPREHLRRHQPLRLGREGRGPGGARPQGAADRAPRRHQRRGGAHRAESGLPIITADSLADAAHKAVAAACRRSRLKEPMSILIDETTKVIVQGFTGDKATASTRRR